MPISKINGIDINKITKINGVHRNDLLKFSGTYLRSYAASFGSVTLDNTYLDISFDNAFAYLSGIDLSAYQDGLYDLVIFDSAGKQIRGRIKAEAPAGETLGAEILLNPGCESSANQYWSGKGYVADPRTGSGGADAFYGVGTYGTTLIGADIDGDGVDEIIYNSGGKLYYYDRVGGVVQINTVTIEDGCRIGTKVCLDFTSVYGIWGWNKTYGYVRWNATSSDWIFACDTNNDGVEDLYGHYPTFGEWIYTISTNLWARIHSIDCVDSFRDGRRIYAYWGAPYNAWSWYDSNNTAWVGVGGVGTVTDKRRWVGYQQIVVENGHCYKYGGWLKADTNQNVWISIQPYVDYAVNPIDSITHNTTTWTELYRKFTAAQDNYLFLLREDIEPKTAKILIDDVTVKQYTDIPATGVHIVSNAEDYTEYTELDAGGYLTITANSLTALNVPTRWIDIYSYRDLGVNFFDGDFEIEFDLKTTAAVGFTWYTYPTWWAVTNDINDCAGLVGANRKFLWLGLIIIDNLYKLYLQEYDGSTNYQAPFYSLIIGTTYYITIRRIESIGTFGTLYLDIYTDVKRTTCCFSTSLALHEKIDFRYLFNFNVYNDSYTIVCISSGESKNMRIINPKINDYNTRRWDRDDAGFNRNDPSGYTYQVRRI